MKSWLMAGLLLTGLQAAAQKKDLSLDKLMSLAVMPEPELNSTLAKKGFRADADSVLYFVKTTKQAIAEKTICLRRDSTSTSICFASSDIADLQHLAQELKQNGFTTAPASNLPEGIGELYQKGDISATPAVLQHDGINWYQLTLQRKRLPAAQQISYIEDLLLLPSHEYMAAVFGPGRIRKDLFYFSDKEVSKCSILFPNTSQQVIIVWKDQVHNRGISLLVAGGQPERGASTAFYRPVAQGGWQSAQGIYPGMTLRQLQEANGGPLELYGWETEEPGVVAATSKGMLNFKSLGVQLNCLDCNEDRFYSQTPLISSAALLQHNRRVYVTTIVYRAP